MQDCEQVERTPEPETEAVAESVTLDIQDGNISMKAGN